ncbi:DUF5018 domain-containing protein [Spirosoma taeanense]|nr:DUF5018 domain-containing protein [Spirosoma taeanense]
MKAFLQSISLLFFLWLVFAQCSKTPDTPVTPKSSAKSLTNPVIDGISSASATYDAATFTHMITVPFGTDVTALKISFTLPSGATVKPVSGSVQNFTNPVSYTVTAEDTSTQTYTVKVVVQAAPKSSEKQITSFIFAALTPAVSASIAQATHAISATVPAEANLTALVPTVSVSAKATVSPASGIAQNFINPVNYTVTAEDGSQQIYEVKIAKGNPTSNNIGCLISRIDNLDTSENINFQYDSQGRVTKIDGTYLSGNTLTGRG